MAVSNNRTNHSQRFSGENDLLKRSQIPKPPPEGILEQRNIEKILIIIKPDHVHLADIILNELDSYGKRVKTARVNAVPRELVEQHYSVHKGKIFYEWVVDSFAGRPVVIAVYEGRNIIQKFSEVIGPTDPVKASKESIRGKYSTDSQAVAVAEKRALSNVIHRSDSVNEAEREMKIWERFLKD